MNKLIPISAGLLLAALTTPVFAQVPPSVYRKQEREKAEDGRQANPQPPLPPPRTAMEESNTTEERVMKPRKAKKAQRKVVKARAKKSADES